jgi:hypothetical protein
VHATARVFQKLYRLLDDQGVRAHPYYMYLARSNPVVEGFEFTPRAVHAAGRLDEPGKELIGDAARRLLRPKRCFYDVQLIRRRFTGQNFSRNGQSFSQVAASLQPIRRVSDMAISRANLPLPMTEAHARRDRAAGRLPRAKAGRVSRAALRRWADDAGTPREWAGHRSSAAAS